MNQASSTVVPELSIVTTACNEAGNVEEFLSQAQLAVAELGVSAEILYFDDGSRDGTGEKVKEYAQTHGKIPIRLVRHGVRRGISASLFESIQLAEGKYVCYLPADLESSPLTDIPLLYRGLEPDIDVVVGARVGRNDGKSFASWVYNSLLAGWLFGVRLRDANWIKLVRREKLQGISLRSDWHRLLMPILAHRGCKFKEVDTPWHPRKYGSSNFGLKRFPVAAADILTLKLLLSYAQRPMLLFVIFGGIALFLSGILLVASLIIDSSMLRLMMLLQIASVGLAVFSGISLGLGFLGELLLTQTAEQPAPPPVERCS